MARVTAATIVDAVLAADAAVCGAANGAGAEGIFISCTALPALGVIGDLEARLGKPVVSSNQASLWRLLHHAELSPAPDAPGRLFEVAPLELAA